MYILYEVLLLGSGAAGLSNNLLYFLAVAEEHATACCCVHYEALGGAQRMRAVNLFMAKVLHILSTSKCSSF